MFIIKIGSSLKKSLCILVISNEHFPLSHSPRNYHPLLPHLCSSFVPLFTSSFHSNVSSSRKILAGACRRQISCQVFMCDFNCYLARVYIVKRHKFDHFFSETDSLFNQFELFFQKNFYSKKINWTVFLK